jgi:hypothetical protein
MCRSSNRILVVFLCLCWPNWWSKLQGQLLVSTIRGTVVDASGLGVNGAEVSVVNLGTNLRRSVRTNETGDFEVTDVLNGTYRLTVTQTGFRRLLPTILFLRATRFAASTFNWRWAQ